MSKKVAMVSKNFMNDMDSSSDDSSIDEEILKKMKKAKKQVKIQTQQQTSILEQSKQEKIQQKEQTDPLPFKKVHTENPSQTPVQPPMDYNERKQFHKEKQVRTNQADHEIIVRNLPKDVYETDIQDFFGDYFEIASINLLKNRMTGNSLGIAFIRLPSDMALKKAVDLNKMIWRDSELSVEATRKKTTVFIKNLSFNTTESSLGQVMVNYEGFIGCRVAKDATGRARGFAHADFDSSANAQKFCDSKAVNVDGRNIVMEMGKPQAPSQGQQKNQHKNSYVPRPQASFNQPQQNSYEKQEQQQEEKPKVIQQNYNRGTEKGGIPVDVSREELAYKLGSISGFAGTKKKL